MGELQFLFPQKDRVMNTALAHKADPGVVLAKAVTRASALLGISGAALSRIIGVSEPTVSRIVSGDRPLNPDSKEGELAAMLVRLFRSLDALVGVDDQKRVAWMKSHNRALGGTPSQLIERADGLVATLNYLDGMRAPA
jgi:plasmid maintenance system antidote protein VapI